MKLTLEEIKTETSDVFTSESFDIGDKRIVMEILRSKMYSNPIRTICQEVMSNARDAHREVGLDERPIHVKLPNTFDESFQVQDFGPGITPDRIRDIFIRYGNSTKRSDNVQTGGFGLGAKSPFSYSDTFTVVTVTPKDADSDEAVEYRKKGLKDKAMIRREYVAYVDESRHGCMNLVKEEETTEEQGTTIVVSSKPVDFANFKRWAIHVGTHWNSRPDIIGQEVKWPELKVEFGSDKGDWFVYKMQEDRHDFNMPMALVDGIPYTIHSASIVDAGSQETYQNIFNFPVRLKFEVGELSITANREDIDYQGGAVKRIRERLQDIIKELEVKASQKVKSAKNLRMAHILWRETDDSYKKIIRKVTWNGYKINGSSKPLQFGQYRNSNKSYLVRRGYTNFDFERETEDHMHFGRDRLLTIDDTGNTYPSRGRLATLFVENPDVKFIYILNFNGDGGDWKKKATEEGVFEMDPIYLSKIEMTSIPRGSYNNGGSTYGKVREFICRDQWNRTHKDVEKDTGFYVETFYNSAYLDDKNTIYEDTLSSIKQIFGIKIYAISKRYRDQIGSGWVPLKKYLLERLKELRSDPEVQSSKVKDAHNITSYLIKDALRLFNTLEKHITSSDNLIRKFLEIVNEANKSQIRTKLGKLNIVEVALDGMDEAKQILQKKKRGRPKKVINLTKLKEEIDLKYPLLMKFYNAYGLRSNDIMVKELAFYINAKG